MRPYAPYALSFVNDDNQTNHFQVYWNEQSGYTLDESKEDEPLSSLRYAFRSCSILSLFQRFR